MRAHCAVASDWSQTDSGEFPLRGEIAGFAALIRANDYPAEPMYSVLLGGQNIGSLGDWPPAWRQIEKNTRAARRVKSFGMPLG